MSRTGQIISLTLFTVFCCAGVAFSQTYRVGSTVYVNAYYGGCVRATVKGTDPAYSVHIEEGSHQGTDLFYAASRMAECKQGAPATAAATTEPRRGGLGGLLGGKKENVNAVVLGGKFKVGERVDVYESATRPKDRGTVVEVSGARFKVHYDGCDDKFDTWEDPSHIRPEATVGKGDADIAYLMGKWSMVISGNSSSAIAWGKAPGLQINSNGTFVWYQDGGRGPVKGNWTTYAKMEGANKFNIAFEPGVLIKDPTGAPWKVFRSKGLHGEDTVSVNMLCMAGRRETGFRVK